MSVDEEFSNRRRRYLIMMAGRALSVIGAVAVYGVSPLLAAAFLVLAAVLPWAAVLLANSRPPKQAMRFRRFVPGAARGPGELTATTYVSGAEQPYAGTRPPPDPAARAHHDGHADPTGRARIIDL